MLPTHRVVRGLGDDGVAAMLDRLDDLFEVERDVSAPSLIERFESAGLAEGGAGRFGLWTRDGGALLTARRDELEPFLPDGGPALRALDVTLLGAALGRLAGLDPRRWRRARSATRSRPPRRSTRSTPGSMAPTLRSSSSRRRSPRSIAVAADGDVMPQKSTYFYPKALTGLVINPHEW